MAASGLQRRKIEVLFDGVDSLPVLPGVAAHVLPLALGGRGSRRDLALAIEADGVLTARVMRLAVTQGAAAGDAGSVSAAMDRVPPEVLAASLLCVETVAEDVAETVRLRRLWRHTLAVGMASQIIATRLGTVDTEAALLAGMLHDIGAWAMAVLLPKSYRQVLDLMDATGQDVLEAERAILGVDHAVLGKRLALRWGLSPAVQNALWLHHQAQVPGGGPGATSVLAQIVCLADLLVRQHGFAHGAAEQIQAHPAEVAERLGLSGAHAEQIARQVAAAFDLNAGPSGYDDRPTAETLRGLLAEANSQLGLLVQDSSLQCRTWQMQAQRATLLTHVNSALAACRTTREVLAAVASAARQAMDVRLAAPYVVGRDGSYVEGLRWTEGGRPENEHFLYDISTDTRLDADPGEAELAAHGGPVRAERLESWLFERQGDRMGRGPFYTVAMTVEGRKVGGLVLAPRAAPASGTDEGGQLAALASLAGIALKRIQAEGDLVALSEELAEANRGLLVAQEQRLQRRNVASLSAMAAGAAHEINNPLAVISGRAQQLAAEVEEPRRREMLQAIIAQAARISDIIADLRLFAQPPAPQVRVVDAVALARGVVEEFASAPGPRAARVLLEAAETPLPIAVDPDQVAGALREIVRNGVEACSRADGGTVRVLVQALATDTAVRLLIIDDGPGMPPQVRARAFDPFYCGMETGSNRGLGLPKAYRAVQASGGQMTLESALDQGTTVRVTFPAAAGADAGTDADAAGWTTGKARKERNTLG